MISLSNFPEEIQVKIFLRLPVRSILTCKCVCKVWCSLLWSPLFVKNHLDISIQTANPRLIFTDRWNNALICSIDYDSIASSSGDPIRNIRIDYPFKFKEDKFAHFFGSCNGLICLSVTNRIANTDSVTNRIASTDKDDNFYIIWNPTTREHKKVTPPHDISSESIYGFSYGFGHDRKIDDYKLIRMDKKSGCTEILIYTLGSDSWRTMETNPYLSFSGGDNDGVLVNGVLHWFGATGSTFHGLILAFSISDEKLLHVQLPQETIPSGFEVYKSVGLWQDCLCLFDVIRRSRIDIWVMQNYGVTESWAKKITISQTEITKHCYPNMIRSHKDGEILIRSVGDFILFNPTNKRIRKVHLHDITEVGVSVKTYVESLVSPQGTSGMQTK